METEENNSSKKTNSKNEINSKQESTARSKLSRRGFITALGASGLVLAGGSMLYWPNRWRYIVVHHSAGNYGNIKFLQKVHRQRQAGDPIDAIPYHYIIGNGNGMKMGEIASDWRKENNLWGAHVSGKNSERNFLGLGICMIGNFDKAPVPKAQFESLVQLCKKLMQDYQIPVENINGHGLIAGEQTLCPGKFMSIEKLKTMLT